MEFFVEQHTQKHIKKTALKNTWKKDLRCKGKPKLSKAKLQILSEDGQYKRLPAMDIANFVTTSNSSLIIYSKTVYISYSCKKKRKKKKQKEGESML